MKHKRDVDITVFVETQRYLREAMYSRMGETVPVYETPKVVPVKKKPKKSSGPGNKRRRLNDRGPHWDVEKQQEICRLYALGYGCKAIGNKLIMGHMTVRRILVANGVEIRSKGAQTKNLRIKRGV